MIIKILIKRNKIFISFLVVAILNLLVGCYSAKIVDKEKLHTDFDRNEIGDITIITESDERIIIRDKTFKIINDTLFAKGLFRNPDNYFITDMIDVKIDLADVKSVWIEESDHLATGMLFFLGIGLVLLIIIGISMSNQDYSPSSCSD